MRVRERTTVSKLHDKVNRNRMTQNMYVYIPGITELGQRQYIRLGFYCGTPFFARRAQYKDAGAWGNET